MLDPRTIFIKNNQLDYLRLGIPFHTTTGDNPQLGHVYIAHPNKLTEGTLVNDN